MKITHLKTRHLFAAACAALLFGACDAGTEVDETAELPPAETTVAETEPMTTTTMDEESAFAAVTLADLDTNQDQQVSRDEYDTWFGNEAWGGLDANSDQQVAQNELGDTFWVLWDENADGAVDEQEYTQGREAFAISGVTYPEFGEAAGDDQRWTRDEFDPWFQQNVWATWDTDSNQQLTRDEAADTWWDLWDGNDDDMIDDQELSRFGNSTATTDLAATGDAAAELDAS